MKETYEHAMAHLKMWAKYNLRGPVLAAGGLWRRTMCGLIDHDWQPIPWTLARPPARVMSTMACTRCGVDMDGRDFFVRDDRYDS